MSASNNTGWSEPPAPLLLSPAVASSSGARSPSRLRCTYAPVHSGGGSINASADTATGTTQYQQRALSPYIVRVDHVGGGSGSSGGWHGSGRGEGDEAGQHAAAEEEAVEDVRIEHVAADEARRRAEVEAGIISQVDGMAAYFTALADADAAAIARLQSTIAAKDRIISELQGGGHGRQPPPPPQQQQQQQQQQPVQQQEQQKQPQHSHSRIFVFGSSDGGSTRGAHSSWGASRKYMLGVALAALVLVAIIIGLASGLGVHRSREAARTPMGVPPEFVRAPFLLAAVNGTGSSSSSSSNGTGGSLNVQVELTRPGTVHYAVVRASAAWENSAAAVVQAAAGLLGGTALEGAAVACGQLPVPLDNVNFTLSIGSQVSAECAQAAPTAADGRSAPKSCARCPSLQPSTPYVVYLVPSSRTGVGALASIEVASDTVRSPSSTPSSMAISRGGGGGGGRSSSVLLDDAVIASVRVAAAGDAGFNLTFALRLPGTLHFAVVHATLLARAGRSFVAFDVDPQAVLWSSITGSSTGNSSSTDDMPISAAASVEANGAVVHGTCTLAAANIAATCRIGPGSSGQDAPGTYACSSEAVTCVVRNACFGGLCEASAYSILPETGYNVFGQAVGEGGGVYGAPRLLGSFRTAPPQNAPRVLAGLRIDAASVRADRFAVAGVGQDRPGFVYVVVVRDDAPPASGQQVQAGQATNFTLQAEPQAHHRKRLRALLAAAAGNVTLLPPEFAAPAAGSAVLPPCAVTRACATDAMVNALVGADAVPSPSSAPGRVALAECVPVQRGSRQEPATIHATRLADDAMYRVLVATSDADGRVAVAAARVRTQDATPPALTIVRVQPPGFASIDVVAALSEPGVVYGAIAPSAQRRNATEAATCPPNYQAPQLQEMSQDVAAAGAEATFSFTGLQANSDYDISFVARDAAGNCQAQTTVISVHTADNVAPVTLSLQVVDTLGDGADLAVRLDEPAAAYFVAAAEVAGGGAADAAAAAAALCPEPAAIFAAGGAAADGGSKVSQFASAGRVDVPPRAPFEASIPVRGLASETRYITCVVAEDATQQRNRQSAPALVHFQTRDVTPPTALIHLVNGTDGGGMSCQHSPPYTCKLAWSVALSEPGWARWALFVNNSSVAQAAFSAAAAQSLQIDADLLATAPTMAAVLRLAADAPAPVAEGNITLPSGQGSEPIEVAGLPSGTSYVLLLVPSDVARPRPNVAAAPTLAAILAPDVTPPILQAVSLVNAADAQLDFAFEVDEAATVAFVLRRAASSPGLLPPPSVGDVLAAGRGDRQAMADVAAAGLLTARANESTPLSVTSGLVAGTFYNLHLAAIDAAGNPQLEVTTLRSVRTTDTVPPVLAELEAVWAPPMRLVLKATASKPGLLRFALQHGGGDSAAAPPASARGLIGVVAANDLSRANFTGSLALHPAPAVDGGAVGTATLCIADGPGMVLHAVAQDQEGAHAGRWPNNSTLTSVQVKVSRISSSGASCEPAAFLASLRPALAFAADGPGLMIGASNVSVDPATGVVTWSQAAGAFTKGGAAQTSALPAVLAPPAAQTVVSAGASLIGPGPSVAIKAPPPASASLLVLSRALVPEGAGASLRLSYQLRDAGGGTAVDTSGIALRPQLAFAAATDPSQVGVDVNATHALPDCTGAAAAAAGGGLADPASGIGECSVAVGARFFPSAGSVDATVALHIVQIGSDRVVGAAEPQPVELAAGPGHAPFLPSSPGVVVSLPARPLHTGEAFEAVVAAANPMGTGITGWALPLRYDPELLELVGATPSDLWARADVTGTASSPGAGAGDGSVVSTITASARAAGQPAERYRSSSSIPLATVTFVVRGRVPAAYDRAVSAVASGAWLSPEWPAPPLAFRDHRPGSGSGGEGASGSIVIAPTRVVGLWAWSESSDIFNTAALNGVRVSTRLFAATVRNWGAPAAVPTLPSSCTLAAGAAQQAPAAGLPPAFLSPSIEPGGCVLHIDGNAASLAPARKAVATLGANGLTATATFSVWQPARAAVAADDPVLNSVLPLNAAPSPPGCADRYQATRLRALVDWTNGDDVLEASDATALVVFASNNTRSVAVAGATARGVAPGAAAISFGAASVLAAAPAVLTVTEEPACLLALEPLAITGVELSGGASPLAAAAEGAVVAERGSGARLAWRAAQQLRWEGARARVITVARFDDGAAVDVSGRAILGLSPALTSSGGPSSGAAVPFALATDASGAQVVTVNASISGAGPTTVCSSFLQASWEVCSRPLGSGAGRLVVDLPAPRAIVGARAQPGAIAAAGDPATLPPISLPTAAALSLAVDFSDGAARDFSRDGRASFSVAVGSTLCRTERAPDGGWRLLSSANATVGPAGDSCVVTARVAFAGAAPLEANVTVQVLAVRGVALYALPPAALAAPELPPPPALAPLGASLRLLRCDARNYDSATLWPAAALTNCSGPCAPTIGLANCGWVALASSNVSVATIGAAFPSKPAYPTYPLLDNRLVAAAPGTTVVSLAFGSARLEVAVSVEDTYAPGWPRAAPVAVPTAAALAGGTSGGALAIEAIMVSEGFVVTALAVPSADARLGTPDAPAAAEVEARGVALAPDAARGGGASLAATIAGLAPGTNYTVLLAVRRGAALASGVTALAGLLVPDALPPSFTAAAVSGLAANATTGAFSARLDVGLDEPGAVSYAVYYGGGGAGAGGDGGDDSGISQCLTADPTIEELRSGANLADAGKCACGAAYCGPAARGRLSFSADSGALRDAVAVSGALPAGPYEALRDAGSDVLSCAPPWEPRAYAPRGATLYLVAEDDAPTYAGWGSACGGGGGGNGDDGAAGPPPLPGPCAPTTVVRCNNTPPARETTNVQAPPFALWSPSTSSSGGGYGGSSSSGTESAAAALPPLRRPLRVPLALPTPGSGPIAFEAAELAVSSAGAAGGGSSSGSGGVALTFQFALDRPGLVRYALVRNVVEVLAWGMRPAYMAGAREAVVLSRDCAGAPLPPGTAYGVWYNATDTHGAATRLKLLSLG